MPQLRQQTMRDEVLDKTMLLFWKNGFFNTSIEDITETTGFNRAAIYKNFGGKEGLFVAMLKRYRNHITPQLTAPLCDPALSICNIKLFFSQFIKLYNQNCLSDGCFLIATASDFPCHNKDTSILIKDFFEYLRQLFRNILDNVKSKNGLKQGINVNSVSDFLVGNVIGLMTLSRSQVSGELLENHINGVMDFLSTISSQNSES